MNHCSAYDRGEQEDVDPLENASFYDNNTDQRWRDRQQQEILDQLVLLT